MSKCWKQEKLNWKRDGFVLPKSAQSGFTGLSGGAPDRVRCARLALENRLLSGVRRRCTAINHRTVRWCTGLSGEPFTGEVVALGKRSTAYGYNSSDCSVSQRRPRLTVVCAINGRHVAEPTVGWSHRTVRCAPDSVRWCTGLCPVRQAGVCQLAALGTSTTVYDYKSPDCPVVHRTVR